MTGFSRRPQDVAAARAFLIEAAARPDDSLPTYGEVAAIYGGIARAVGPVLNTIARDCEADGSPDLTALVVDRGTKLHPACSAEDRQNTAPVMSQPGAPS